MNFYKLLRTNSYDPTQPFSFVLRLPWPVGRSHIFPSPPVPSPLTLTVPPNTKLGLDDWLPVVAPVKGESFLGIDRSMDPIRLAGNRWTYDQNTTVQEAVLDSAAIIAREGGAADLVLAGTANYASLFDQTTYRGLRSFKVISPYGPVTVLEEPSLGNDIFVLQSDTWEIASNGCLICKNPGGNCRISFAGTQALSKAPVCDCGADKVGSSRHSSWCSKS